MSGIFHQWKRYFEWVHFNLLLKKRYERVLKIYHERKTRNDWLDNEIKTFEKGIAQYLGQIRHINDSENNKNIYLVGREMRDSKFTKFIDNIKSKIPFFNFDGYIFYFNKSNSIKILKIKNLKNILNLAHCETYNIIDRIGIYKNKPAFLIKYPYAITLQIRGEELYYDAEAYYNYVNIATKGNLTKGKGEPLNIFEFIKNNIILIVIVIFVLFALFTPEGKNFIAGIMGNAPPPTTPIRP